MAFDGKSLDDYVDVATRLADFRERYPEGSLQPADPARPWEQATVTGYAKDGKAFTATMIVYVAAAYRTPDDTRPGIGCAWEPFPGRTPYTAGSELMNAETSAWGRAILAVLASDSRKGVASREEVRNRLEDREEPARPTGGSGAVPAATGSTPAPGHSAAATPPERTRARIPGPGHERLRDGTARGAVEGSERLRAVPPDDPWYDAPGQPLAEPEGRPGTITGEQQRAMHAAFGELGIKDRAARLAVTAEIVGRAVPSSAGLSYVEAGQLLAGLHERASAPADAS